MISLALLFLCRILYDWHLDKKLLTHPITIALYVYLLWMFLPVLYALLLYRMRTLSWKVILILDAVYLAAVLLLSQDITCSAGMMEAFLLSIVILFLAIKRGILPGKKRLLYLAADGLPDGKRGDRLYCQQYSAGTAWLFIVGWGKDQ